MGAQGMTGVTGAQGSTGAIGYQGSTGVTGSQGFTGAQGSTGTQGSSRFDLVISTPTYITNNGLSNYVTSKGNIGTAWLYYCYSANSQSSNAFIFSCSVFPTDLKQYYFGVSAGTSGPGGVGGSGLVYGFYMYNGFIYYWQNGAIQAESTTYTINNQLNFLITTQGSQLKAYVNGTLLATRTIAITNTPYYLQLQFNNDIGSTTAFSNIMFDINSYGVTGAQGSIGITGATGAAGTQGNTGAQGSTGVQGSTGAQGMTGVTGAPGFGSTGSKGYTGAIGAQGFTGPQGFTSSQGSIGTIGFTGSQGATGSQGYTGPIGSQGAQGAIGTIGTIGTQGVGNVQGPSRFNPVISDTYFINNGGGLSNYASSTGSITGSGGNTGNPWVYYYYSDNSQSSNSFIFSCSITPTILGKQYYFGVSAGKSSPGGSGGFGLIYGFVVYNGTINYLQGGTPQAESTTYTINNQLNFLITTQGSQLKAYVNGTLLATRTIAITNTPYYLQLQFGSDISGTTVFSNIMFDNNNNIGATGAQGIIGTTGTTIGSTGSVGTIGAQGNITGPQGTTGATGAQGTIGPAGPDLNIVVGTVNGQSSSTSFSYKSPNGSWTYANSNGYFSTQTKGGGVAYNGTQWVAASTCADTATQYYSIAYSSNAKNWTFVSGSQSNLEQGWCVVWTGTQWIVGGGKKDPNLGTSVNILAYSSDGINWIYKGNSGSANPITYTGFPGSLGPGAVVSMGCNGTTIVYSGYFTNGPYNGYIAYANVSTPFNLTYASTPYGNILGFSNQLCPIVWNGTYFCAGASCDTFGTIMYSADGITWNTTTSNLYTLQNNSIPGQLMYSLAWGNGVWVAGFNASAGAANYALYSTGLTGWNAVSGLASDYYISTAFDGQTFYTNGKNSGKIYTSSTGASWSLSTTYSGTNAIMLAGAQFFTGANGAPGANGSRGNTGYNGLTYFPRTGVDAQVYGNFVFWDNTSFKSNPRTIVQLGNNLNTAAGNYVVDIGNASATSAGTTTGRIAIGTNSTAYYNQGNYGLAIGNQAAWYQGQYSVALGLFAASGQAAVKQGNNCIAIGHYASYAGQTEPSIAIGKSANWNGLQSYSIAIGFNAGNSGPSASNTTCIGYTSGSLNQGSYSIAIGYYAGYSSLPANTICINAVNATYSPASSGFYVQPLRGGGTGPPLIYNSGTSEIASNNTGKPFVIDHPLHKNKKNDKYLVHACVEGPETGVYYRGKGEITNNENVEIKLPDYATTIATDFTVHITPIYKKYKTTVNYAVSKVCNGSFIVYGDNGKFYWSVYGKRGSLNVEPLKSESPVYGDGPYKWRA